MSELTKYKTNYLAKRSQFVIFDFDGLLLNSCNTLIDLSQYKSNSLFEKFPIIESLCAQFNDLEVNGETISIPRIEMKIDEEDRYFDYIFSKIEVENSHSILLIINDYTAQYEYLIKVQQERNEAIVDNEYLLIEQELNQLDKNINSLKIENLFKTSAFLNINDIIIDPIIAVAKKLNVLVKEQTSPTLQSKINSICENINSIVNNVNMNSIFSSDEKLRSHVISQKAFNLNDALWFVSKLFHEKLSSNNNCKIQFKLSEETPKQIISDKYHLIITLCNLLIEVHAVFIKDEVEIDVLLIDSEAVNEVVRFGIKRTDLAINNQLINELSDLSNKAGYVKQVDLSRVNELLKKIDGNLICNLQEEGKYLIEIEFPYELAA